MPAANMDQSISCVRVVLVRCSSPPTARTRSSSRSSREPACGRFDERTIQGTHDYSVQVCGPAGCETAPVGDIGPWNTQDDYWDASRAEFTDLAQGTPEAQAAYDDGHNGGYDDLGGQVSNPAGIDLADGTFYDVGLNDNGYVTVTCLWT
jgi:hypothetical protein